MPEDVRKVFADAVRLYAQWLPAADTPMPTIDFRSIVVSLSGVCDLGLAFKNEQLPTSVHDELWRSLDSGQNKFKAEIAVDPSYATAARCLDALVQAGRLTASVSSALSAKDQMDFEL